MLRDLPFGDSVDVNRFDLERLSGGRLAHELPGVGAAGGNSNRDPVAIAEGVKTS
jgi:hypothetical protein